MKPIRIVPHLWFDDEAEEAAQFYVSVFPGSKLGRVTRYTEAGKETHRRPPGSVMTVEFTIAGQPFLALNGGPVFSFNESVSFIVSCPSQREIDRYWEALSAGGDPQAQVCGWLKDRFGLSWQVVPAALPALLGDEGKAERVMEAMMRMKRIDIEALRQAAEA